MGTIEVLAHELAHVAVGPGCGHGESWEAEFSAINEMFNGENHNHG